MIKKLSYRHNASATALWRVWFVRQQLSILGPKLALSPKLPTCQQSKACESAFWLPDFGMMRPIEGVQLIDGGAARFAMEVVKTAPTLT